MDDIAARDASTRVRVLDLIITLGPVSSAELAQRIELTAAGIRRHISSLEADGLITDHEPAGVALPRRGRPARHYIATDTGRDRLSNAYSDLATSALGYLARTAGTAAVAEFAASRTKEVETRYRVAVDDAGPDPGDRAVALATALTHDGFAATIREVGRGGVAIQLCQGHCPVLKVAHEFPQLCDAELSAFSRLLGVHVQRLATLAEGEHVCTTHIPLFVRPRLPEGTP